jgi:hypothetical protein
MATRTQQLLKLIDEFQHAHDRWVNDLERPQPDEAYWTAVEKLIHGFAEANIPSTCRALATAVDRLSAEVDRFDQREDPAQLYPDESFWQSRDALQNERDAMRAREFPPLEPIDELREQNVSDTQICHIYGFLDRRGCPMPWLVQQELDEPGSVLSVPNVIDGRTWEDPRELQRRATAAAEAAVDSVADPVSDSTGGGKTSAHVAAETSADDSTPIDDASPNEDALPVTRNADDDEAVELSTPSAEERTKLSTGSADAGPLVAESANDGTKRTRKTPRVGAPRSQRSKPRGRSTVASSNE